LRVDREWAESESELVPISASTLAARSNCATPSQFSQADSVLKVRNNSTTPSQSTEHLDAVEPSRTSSASGGSHPEVAGGPLSPASRHNSTGPITADPRQAGTSDSLVVLDVFDVSPRPLESPSGLPAGSLSLPVPLPHPPSLPASSVLPPLPGVPAQQPDKQDSGSAPSGPAELPGLPALPRGAATPATGKGLPPPRMAHAGLAALPSWPALPSLGRPPLSVNSGGRPGLPALGRVPRVLSGSSPTGRRRPWLHAGGTSPGLVRPFSSGRDSLAHWVVTPAHLPSPGFLRPSEPPRPASNRMGQVPLQQPQRGLHLADLPLAHQALSMLRQRASPSLQFEFAPSPGGMPRMSLRTGQAPPPITIPSLRSPPPPLLSPGRAPDPEDGSGRLTLQCIEEIGRGPEIRWRAPS
jgi:hypothetical protein